jgi:hypothetical protein
MKSAFTQRWRSGVIATGSEHVTFRVRISFAGYIDEPSFDNEDYLSCQPP